MDRRELFRNALGAAAGVVVPSLWLPALLAPKPAAAAVATPMAALDYPRVWTLGEDWYTAIPYQGERFGGIDAELARLWKVWGSPATMVMTSRQILDMVHLAERKGSIIRVNGRVASVTPDTVTLGVSITGYKHPVTGEIVKVHGRLARCRDEIWFTSERRNTLCWDERVRIAPIAAGEPWVEGKNFEYR